MEMIPELRLTKDFFFFPGSGVLGSHIFIQGLQLEMDICLVALNEIKNSESNTFLRYYPMLPLEVEICMLVVQHTLLVLCGIIFLLAIGKICLCANSYCCIRRHR